MTIGDVLAVIAVALTIGAAWGATILLVALAFPVRTVRAQEALTQATGICFLRGLAILFVSMLIFVVLQQNPAWPVKFLSLMPLAASGLLAAIGSAGVVRLMSERISGMGDVMPSFAALTRAAMLYVAAGYLPIIGWLCVLPLALFVSLGAGVTAVATPRQIAARVSALETAA